MQVKKLKKFISNPVSIAPLVTFRIIFGLVMLISIIRFAAKGWIHELYVAPAFHFTYFGFDWIKPLPEDGMYLVFFIMGLSALFILLGFMYRWSAIAFFLLFTYVELIDKTYYLNHYYFISIIGFLLILLPANRAFSLDAKRKPSLASGTVPAWTINILIFQLAIVYFYAGLAKINPEWLLEALPLKIWLPARAYLPVIGELFSQLWVAYAFSWAGMLYDLSIPFLLLNSRTRPYAYGAVIFFHVMTRILFPIGMFPFIMIGLTLIFFPAGFHEKLLRGLEKRFVQPAGRLLTRFLPTPKPIMKFNSGNGPAPVTHTDKASTKLYKPAKKPVPGYLWLKNRPRLIKTVKDQLPLFRPAGTRLITFLLVFHFAVQLLFPFRHVLYPGKLFWTEEGYRFSWRVMLMEKAGMCTFYVKNKGSDPPMIINNRDHLTVLQERMMTTQPDMILQFVHYLRNNYTSESDHSPQIYAESRVTLQGHRSRPMIDPDVNLAEVKRNLEPKNWILPFETAH